MLGKPSPPQSSKYHPLPSPPPNAPVYTTEHGYLTVTYAKAGAVAERFSLDFFEGKAPDDAFRIVSAYLPSDAVDKRSVVGPKANVRAYSSAWLARALPASHGMLYVECTGAHPASLCEKADVVAEGGR